MPSASGACVPDGVVPPFSSGLSILPVLAAEGVVPSARRPILRPATFGYHEVFHALVVAAATAHYLLVWKLLLR